MDILYWLIGLLTVTLIIMVIAYFIVLNRRQVSSSSKTDQNKDKAKPGSKAISPKTPLSDTEILPKAGSLKVNSGGIGESKLPSRMGTEEFLPGDGKAKSTIPDPV